MSIVVPIYKKTAKYSHNDEIMEDDMGWACSTNGEDMNACKLLVGSRKKRDY
jgi:hypothetical protein